MKPPVKVTCAFFVGVIIGTVVGILVEAHHIEKVILPEIRDCVRAFERLSEEYQWLVKEGE